MQLKRIEYCPISAAGMSTCFGLISRLSRNAQQCPSAKSVHDSLTYHTHLIGHHDGFRREGFTHVQTFVGVGHFAQCQNGRIWYGCFVDLLDFLLNTVACFTWGERLSIEKQRSPVCFRQTRVGKRVGQILIEPLNDLRQNDYGCSTTETDTDGFIAVFLLKCTREGEIWTTFGSNTFRLSSPIG